MQKKNWFCFRFGIVPDALKGELVIRPGLPRAWTSASIDTPDVGYTYRRQGPVEAFDRTLACGDVTVVAQQAKVYKDGREVFLTALEYRLLLALVANQGRVLTRAQILAQIWDVDEDFVNDNTLTVYIKRLREKLEDDPQDPALIKTVYGAGYLFLASVTWVASGSNQ